MMRAYLPALAACLALAVHGQRPATLTLLADVPVQVKEPSDMTPVPGSNGQHFYVVSDNGYVAEIDQSGRLVRRSGEIAFDLEACLFHDGSLMVVDERARRILWLDTADFNVQRRLTMPYGGGRNKAYEALAWHPGKERYLLITERDPVVVFELDREMRTMNEVPFDRSVRDISSGVFHEGYLWLLSDMDMLVLRCHPDDYRILERYRVPVINPEGMAFGADGALHVISDDRQRMYTFQLPR